ncbi:MAG TPA: MlaD family protein [Candidatus Udaeobacter sp.]|jgi:phospholipid/cholesterol/gamma-HCH transport system substrate-binding protein|nr:MlaD family protein [Candidatus Udaeobacter sp.]
MENTRYFRIGVFVITAIVIGVIGVVVLGGGKFFQKTNIIETYIDESVQGLDIGSPVKFRGVPVGNVEEITLSGVEYPTRRSYVVVRAGISRNVFHFPLNDPANPLFIAEVQRGLRVRLAPQGLTGQAYLEADYLNPTLNPPLAVDWKPKHPYVPSARSRITQLSDAVERILRNVEQVDIQRLIVTMENSLATVDKLVSGANLDKVSTQALALLAELRETNRQLRDVVSGPELKSAARDAAVAAGTAREIFQRAEKPLNQLISDLPKVTDSVNRVVQRLDAVSANLPETSADLRKTLQSLNRLISSQQLDIEKTVENLRSTSEAVRQIIDNSKKYPSQTLFGAPPPPSKAMGK